MANQLKALRNKSSAAFLLGNAMLVITVLVLQMNKLYIPGFCEDTHIEPISFVFLVFYVFTMFLQTIGMLIHRTGTFLHIMATLMFPCCQTMGHQANVISKADLQDQVELCRLIRDDDTTEDADSIADTTCTEDLDVEFEDLRKKLTRRNTVCNIKKSQRCNQGAYATMTRAHAARVEKELKDLEDMSDEQLEKKIKENDRANGYTRIGRNAQSAYDRMLARVFTRRKSQAALLLANEEGRGVSDISV